MSEVTADSQSFEDEEDRQRALDEALIDRLLSVLGEHFDAVQIFASRATRDQSEQTAGVSRGIGNWYARRGMVEDWRVQANAETVRDVNAPPE